LAFGKISELQYIHLKKMIPIEFHVLWEEGLKSKDYYLKLCGSGGGGYILGFTQDLEKAKKSLKDYKLEVVYQF
jgi:mevalonate kinase